MQLKIDFSTIKNITDDKKLELVSFRIGDKFKNDLEAIANVKGISLSKLCVEYLISAYTEDYKNQLLIQENSSRTLGELLKG